MRTGREWGPGRGWGLWAALFSSVCFGASGSLGKSLVDAGFSAPQAVWIRVTGAAVVLVPLVFALRGRLWAATARRHWPYLLGYGLAGVAGCQALYFLAASRLPVGVAILLEFTGPVLVVGWVRFVRRAKVARSAGIGVGIALVGLACVVEVWSGSGLDALGLLAGLGAAACQAVYFLTVDRLTGDADPMVLTASGFLIGTVVLTPLAMPWAAPWHILTASVPMGTHTVPAWLPATAIVVVSTLIAYMAGVAAVQRLSATVGSAVAYVEAVAATLIAWVLLGEQLAAPQLAGGAIVLIGAFIAQRAAAPPPTPETALHPVGLDHRRPSVTELTAL